MINEEKIKDFLVDKYGIKIFRYKGLDAVVKILLNKKAPLKRGEVMTTYKELCDTNWQAFERKLRYFKDSVGCKEMTVTDFINTLLLELIKNG